MQRCGRKRAAKTIHAKIANRRKNALHKYSRTIVNDAGVVFVVNGSSSWQISSGRGKATLDVSGWSMLRRFPGECGTVHHRDGNVAANIARLGCEGLGLH